MRIVLVGAAHPYRGGIAHFTTRLHRELSGEHEVRIVTFSRQYPRFLFPGTSQLEPAESPFEVPSERRIDSLAPWTWTSAARSIAGWRPHAAVFNYWSPFFAPCFGLMARHIRRHSETRVLFICHNVRPHERRIADLRLAQFALRSAHSLFAMSRGVEDALRAQFPETACIRINHPPWDSFGLPIPKDEARSLLGIRNKNVILFFGLIRAYKGLDALLEAMSRVDPGLDVLLLVAGEFYQDQRKYERMVEAAGLRESVRLDAFYIPSDRVRLYFSAADAVVLPYLRATQSGIAQIACNFLRPVIGTDVDGIRNVVEPGVTGYLAIPGDASSLARAVNRFFLEGDPERFSENIRIENLKHSWQKLVCTIIEVARGRCE